MPQPTNLPAARLFLGLALLLNAAVVFSPSAPGIPLFPYADKVVHLAIFAIPAALFALAGLSVPAWGAGLTAYAVGTEVIQATLLPQRSGSVGDLVADLSGIALGVLIGWGIPIGGADAGQ